MRKGDDFKIKLIISLFLAWTREVKRLGNKDTVYGKTGYTIGKFITEWVDSIGDVDGQTSAKSFKNRVEAMARVSKKYDIRTIKSIAMLCRLDQGLVKTPKQVATVKNVRFSREQREKMALVLRKGGFTDAQVASVMLFGVMGNK